MDSEIPRNRTAAQQSDNKQYDAAELEPTPMAPAFNAFDAPTERGIAFAPNQSYELFANDAYRDMAAAGFSEGPVFRAVMNAAPQDDDVDFAPPRFARFQEAETFSDSVPHKANVDTRSKVSVFSVANLVGAVYAEPPRPFGGYVEPYHHVFTALKPVEFLPVLCGALKSLNADFVQLPQEFRVDACCYTSCERVSFAVNMFSADDAAPAPYIVEVQRRHGCCMKFNAVYTRLVTELAAQSAVEGPNAIRVPLAALSSPTGLGDIEERRNAVRNLLCMATSSCVDAQCQALASLALMSQDASLHPLLREEAISALLQALESSEEESRRCALTIFCNLTTSTQDSAGLCEKLAARNVVSFLVECSRSKTPEMVRQASRLLVHLGGSLGRAIVNDELMNTLKRLTCSPDPVVRQHVDALQNVIPGLDLSDFGAGLHHSSSPVY